MIQEEQQETTENQQQLNLNIPADVAKGNYANLVITNFSKEEFICDYALVHPHTTTASVQTRAILSPRNTKKLMLLLQQQIEAYEEKHGVISEENNGGPITFSYN